MDEHGQRAHAAHRVGRGLQPCRDSGACAVASQAGRPRSRPSARRSARALPRAAAHKLGELAREESEGEPAAEDEDEAFDRDFDAAVPHDIAEHGM